MKRKTKKSTLKKLQKRAETLWKLYCLQRDKSCRFPCNLRRCGTTQRLQVHHIFSRNKKRIFLDVDNGVVLCSAHHTKITFDDTAKETLRRTLDPDVYERLYEQSKIGGSFNEWKSVEWIEGQIRILQEMVGE